MKKISKGKVVIDLLLLGGVFSLMCTHITLENERTAAAQALKTAQVREVATDSEPATEYAVPYGDTSFKSYMDYRCITNHESAQWALQKYCKTDGSGLRRYGDDYVVALGSYYADHIGDRFKITLESGEEFTAVVGDFKADVHTDASNRYTPMSNGRKNVLEFIVDTKCLDRKAKLMGDISYVDGFLGNVLSIEKVEKND